MRIVVTSCDVCDCIIQKDNDNVGYLKMCKRKREGDAYETTSLFSWGDLCCNCTTKIEDLLRIHKNVHGKTEKGD